MRVSHETIYRSLFVQSRQVLAKDSQKHLRTSRPTRYNIHNTVSKQWRSQIKQAVSITERPAEAEERVIAGHWEGDLIIGRNLSQIGTVVDRATRGTNENTNGLLDWSPKGSSLAEFTQTELDVIAAKLNNRPRKSLGYDTPADRLTTLLH